MYITKKLSSNKYFECMYMYITKKLSCNKYFKSLTEELISGGFRGKYFNFDFYNLKVPFIRSRTIFNLISNTLDFQLS